MQNWGYAGSHLHVHLPAIHAYAYTYSHCYSHRFRQSDTDTQTNAHSEIARDTAATSDSSPAVAVIIHACTSCYVMIKISYDI